MQNGFSATRFIFSILILSLILLIYTTPVTINAAYGASTIVGSSNYNQPQISILQNDNKSNINLTSARKNDIVKLQMVNSSSGILDVEFLVNENVSNANIILGKLNPNEATTGLPITPVALFSINLANLSYDQISNFTFKFKIKGLKGSSQVYRAYSNNSPWVPATLSEPSAIDSNGDITFTASSPTAFKQFAVVIDSTSATSTTGFTQVNEKFNGNTTILDTDDTLVRTGYTDYLVYGKSVIGLITLGFIFFLLHKSNQKENC